MMGLGYANTMVHKLEFGHLCYLRMDLESRRMMSQEGSRLGYDRC
jgi:hypothetical protein